MGQNALDMYYMNKYNKPAQTTQPNYGNALSPQYSINYGGR
jgi:hypothetical protein